MYYQNSGRTNWNHHFEQQIIKLNMKKLKLKIKEGEIILPPYKTSSSEKPESSNSFERESVSSAKNS